MDSVSQTICSEKEPQMIDLTFHELQRETKLIKMWLFSFVSK